MRSSNIYRDSERRWRCKWLLAGVFAILCVHVAWALDPSRAISQYIRNQWSGENGFPGGPVYAITQTTDGYLWIGAEKGLVRFDGLNFVLFDRASPSSQLMAPVYGLAADSEGDLWIRLPGRRVLRRRNGKFEDMQTEDGPSSDGITAMSMEKSGGVLLSAMTKGTLLYKGGKFESLAPAITASLTIISLAQTNDGKVWIGTRDSGLLSINNGQVTRILEGLPDSKINCLLPVGDRELWIGTDKGVALWNGSELTRAGLLPSLGQAQVLAMTMDRESNLWIGTANGIMRLNANGVATLEDDAHLSGEPVTSLFEDREGNLWVGSTGGIERFRDSLFMQYSGRRSPENSGALYVDDKDRTWFSPSAGGLSWLKGDHRERVDAAGLDKEVIYSITGSKDGLWVGRQRGGLTHLHFKDDAFRYETFTTANGLAQNSVYSVYQSRDGTVWAGTLNGGVSRFKNGSFTTYTTANGLTSNAIAAIHEGADGTMWFATSNGLNELRDGRWRYYTSGDGLPPGNLNCLFEDSAGVLWIGTAEGLAFLSSNRVNVPREVPDSLRDPIFGIAEDQSGWLWISTLNHVLRVSRDQLLRGALSDSDLREYGVEDGLPGTEGVKRDRSVIADRRGHIWFSLNRGLSSVNARRVTSNSAPAIVHVEEISADGSLLDLHGLVHVPARSQRLTFTYNGLSLSVPERVRFRYRLDGLDQGWSDPVATRQAIYTNLGVGSYRFRVIASNSDGLWNSSEAVIPFEIEPAFWQVWWFRWMCVLIIALMVFALYRLRLHQLTRQLNVRFEERLAERMRIAHELHDTLLQGFLGASVQLDFALDQTPEEAATRPLLKRALELMRRVNEEGRNALRGLRSPGWEFHDLEQAFLSVPQELEIRGGIDFRVTVQGQPRMVHPFIRDEAYRIGREALVNAFRHARARTIEVELEYASNFLRIMVCDDGCGITPDVLREGREGHWGLPGMRERAARIGAKLKVSSSPANGTVVELSAPAHIAFQAQPANRPRKWFGRRRSVKKDKQGQVE